MFVTDSVKYIGVNDKKIDLFEGQYKVPNGVSYNSYVILDTKIAVMDTVDAAFGDEWLANLQTILGKRTPDYLVVQHMEPDHSANIINFLNAYPGTTVVASAKAFAIAKNFFGNDFSDNRIVVSEGSRLSLGERELLFLTAPMVHWPEVIVTYDTKDKILFTADGFGKFGALDHEEEWDDEARRYYIGIVGKYGAQVKALLKKAAGLDIEKICPLHGPVLEKDLSHYLSLYDTWASYIPEKEGVVIAYSSIYGNTKRAAAELYEMIKDKTEAKLFDLSRCDIHEAIANAFKYSKLVLASSTYNADVFPKMHEFIHGLTERNFDNRTVGLIENGSWAPMAAKVMREMLSGTKNVTFTDTTVKILSAVNDESRLAIKELAEELI
jgi:flavorubredoxin